MREVLCDYCGRPAELVDSTVVYGRSYGHKMYVCHSCNAWVGCHKGTDKPLGRPANAELRRWKMAAHAAFDPLWRSGPFQGKRKQAYRWLAEKMQLPDELTHIGMFDVEQCKQVIEIIQKG